MFQLRDFYKNDYNNLIIRTIYIYIYIYINIVLYHIAFLWHARVFELSGILMECLNFKIGLFKCITENKNQHLALKKVLHSPHVNWLLHMVVVWDPHIAFLWHASVFRVPWHLNGILRFPKWARAIQVDYRKQQSTPGP